MTDAINNKAPVSVTLRPVTDADREFLIAVYDSTRAEELAQVEWQEGQREAFIRWQFERQDEEYRQRFPNMRYDVILVESGSDWTTNRSACWISGYSRSFRIAEWEPI
jgi:hypothetical protein